MSEELITTTHRSGEQFKVRASDLEDGNDRDLIPLFELDGTKRSRADAWRSGRPSDICRSDAKEALTRAETEN